MRALWAAAAMMAVAATGCTDYKCNDYSAYERIADSGWLYGDTLTFVPVHDDSICRGRLAVAVSHDIRYPYTSLWLEVAHTSGRTGALMRDTLAIPVVDRYGTWIGHGDISGVRHRGVLVPPHGHPGVCAADNALRHPCGGKPCGSVFCS